MSGLFSSLYLQKFKRLLEGNRHLSSRGVSSPVEKESRGTLKYNPVLMIEGGRANEKDRSFSVKEEV